MPDKERERHYLQLLSKCLGLSLDEVSEPEPPDFVVVGQEFRLGIEFTKFRLPIPDGRRPRREVESLQDRIVARAQHLYEAEVGNPLYVKVIFSSWDPLKKATVEEHARQLADLVRSLSVPRSLRDQPVEVPIETVPEPFDEISIYGSVDGKDSLWSANSSAWVAEVSSEDIRVQITRKEPMAKPARKQCDELWLVIVNDIFDHGEPVAISDVARSEPYHHSFDRLYWLDLAAQRAIELLRK